MQIAQVLAGYTLGGSDLLRRAMGKKKPEEMAKQRAAFVNGAMERGVMEATATYIFDLMEKFAGYGFNKSHSAAYALLSYQTAWLKTHHPAAFMAAALSSEVDRTEKLVPLIDEVRRLGLELQNPDINLSQHLFTMSGESGIRYGLGAIRGVGEPVVAMLIKEREDHGPYSNLEDLCRRNDLSKLNRRVMEQLIRSGALDSMGPNRPTLLQTLPEAMKLAEQSSRDADVGQGDLFGGSAATALPTAHVQAKCLVDWTARARLEAEFESLGLYLTGHPFAEFELELAPVVSGKLIDLTSARPDSVDPETARFGTPGTIAGLVLDITKRNERVIFMLDDHSARIEVSIFEEQFQPFRETLKKGAIVVVDGNLRFDDYIDGWRFNAKKITDIDHIRETHATRLVIRAPRDMSPQFADQLKSALGPYTGGICPVVVSYESSHAAADIALPAQWAVRVTIALTENLQHLAGLGNVHVQLHRPRPMTPGIRQHQPAQSHGGREPPGHSPQSRLAHVMAPEEPRSSFRAGVSHTSVGRGPPNPVVQELDATFVPAI